MSEDHAIETANSNDLFLRRLISGSAAGLALILLAYSAHLSFQAVPLAREVAKDFGLSLPPISAFIFGVQWLPAIVSALAACAGIAAVITPRRSVLVLSSGSVLLAVAAILFTHYAIQLPQMVLQQAISGGG